MNCNDCENKEFIGTKYENRVCDYCKLQNAKQEFYEDIKGTKWYKWLIKVIDWFEKGINMIANKYDNIINVNGVTIASNGNNIVIRNGKVIVDGKTVAENIGSNDVVINGDCESIECNGSVKITGSAHSIDCGGSCTVSGNVSGNIDAGGSVTCGSVGENIDAGGSVKCTR